MFGGGIKQRCGINNWLSGTWKKVEARDPYLAACSI